MGGALLYYEWHSRFNRCAPACNGCASPSIFLARSWAVFIFTGISSEDWPGNGSGADGARWSPDLALWRNRWRRWFFWSWFF